MLVVSCGDTSDSTDDTPATTVEAAPTTDATTTATEPSPSDATPDEIGEEIGAIYLAAYDDVIAALTDRPESTEAKEQLTTLKDGYIEQLVELGQQREALDASGRATVDATIMRAVMSLPGETLAEYQAAIDHYVADTELDKLIRSFNVIGQYANFDLLREQEPDEATRLGIG